MRYSKTIELSDYETSDTFQHIDNMRGILEGAYTGWGTEHRRWEYGIGLALLRQEQAKTVLEVGGGSSLFAASAIWMEMDVKVVDPDDYRSMFEQQSQRIGKTIPFIHQDFFNYPEGEQFDAVVCISTIEHVPNDADFFLKLLRYVKPGGLLYLTTDFHDSGVALFGGHNRTYNAEMLMSLIALAQETGFEILGEAPDYQAFQPLVHGMYTFASLALKRLG